MKPELTPDFTLAYKCVSVQRICASALAHIHQESKIKQLRKKEGQTKHTCMKNPVDI